MIATTDRTNRGSRRLIESARHWMETEIEVCGAKALAGDAASPAALERAQDLARRLPNGVADVPLLTPAEETEHFRAMNLLKLKARRLQRRLTLSSPRRETITAIERDLASAERLRNHLIRANVRLVTSVAKKFATPRCPASELVSDGYLTLMRAVDKFDFSRGFRFSTYAVWALRYTFSRLVSKSRSGPASLNSGEDERRPEIADPHPIDAAAESRRARWVRSLPRMLDRLDPRERAIIALRYGLQAGVEERSLKEIATEMGVCKERVRQLQLRALSKLRQSATTARLEEADAG